MSSKLREEQSLLTKQLKQQRLKRENQIWETALRNLPKRKTIFMRQEYQNEFDGGFKASSAVDIWQNNRPAKLPLHHTYRSIFRDWLKVISLQIN